MIIIKKFIKQLIALFGYDIINTRKSLLLGDISSEEMEIIKAVKEYTMTQPETIAGLIQAVRYIVRHNIPGALVECGIWKGGSMMAAAMTLVEAGHLDRDLYLFDTFKGMTAPSHRDVDLFGASASLIFDREKISNDASNWVNVPIEEVRKALVATGYPAEKIHLIKGNVVDTIPEFAPESISMLRLDTDWYESTRHELEYLFPRLEQHGILIIDYYGHWRGSREATDKYLDKNNIRMLLTRMDYGARLAVKC